MRIHLFVVVLLLAQTAGAQTPQWSQAMDSVSLFSSPVAVDLNQDGVRDIVVGGGIEGLPTRTAVMALDGSTGQRLWQLPAPDQIFGTALTRDINGDQVADIFIGGRSALFWAVDGATGNKIWEFWPDSLGPPSAAGWLQFYNAQWVPDLDQDGVPDLLTANGGDRFALPYDSLRPPGSLVLLSGRTGQLIARDTVPDGHETYFSPLLLDVDGAGDPWVIFGTGGETVRGRLWAIPLSDLRSGDISGASPLLDDSLKGMIASPSLADLDQDGVLDLVVPELNGRLTALGGDGFVPLWSREFPGYEMYTAPTVGQFTGDATPDVFVIAARGQWSFYSQYLQILVDGATGQIAWTDTATHYQFSQVNAADRDGDGWDEVLIVENRDIGFFTLQYRNQLQWIDFNDNQISDVGLLRNGLNIFSTPALVDLDGDQSAELVLGYHPQTANWAGMTDAVIERLNLGIPVERVAWPGYMGRDRDGVYHPAGFVAAEPGKTPPPVQVYPNPVADRLWVRGRVPRATRLIDGQGRVVRESARRADLVVRGLAAGLYVLEVERAGETVRTKVIVE
ncbi:MAG: PQQ-binding-like beta-propeller repeat protein [Bacteroidota bacterium]